MDELSMDEIKISDMDEEIEFTNEEYETEETEGPVYEDDDLSSIAMPVISDMDAVVDYSAVQYETEEEISSDAANKFSQTGDDLDSVEMPVFSDMDAAAGKSVQPETEPEAAADIDAAAAPSADDMYEKPAASSAPKASEPPRLAKPQPEGTDAPAEKTMSARERRMAEPFDMPGAYVPGEQNAPSKYVPKPPAQSAPPAEQSNSAYNQYQPEPRRGNDDFLDNLYGQRQAEYDKGAKKAKILGIIVIVLSVLTFISSMSNSRADSWDKIIAVATVIVTPLCAWKFMKGSNGCRRVLGIISLCDAGKSVLSIVALKGLVSLINKGLGTNLSINPFIIFLIVLEAIGFAAMAYFFLIDKQVSDFTTDD